MGTVRTTVLPRRAAGDAPGIQIPSQARFERLDTLGRGGIGEVALVQDHDISRCVAVKRLRDDRQGPDALLRFAEEVRVVGQLEHPGIVPIHDVGIDENGQHYLVMKYVEGDTLEHVIERLRAGDTDYGERFTVSYRVQVFTAILEAIGYAHDRGIIHRDIKPANVMIGPHGEVTVMDWGIAKRVGDGGTDPTHDDSLASTVQDRPIQTQQGALVGTPSYMSPEQAAGRNDELDVRSDIFSLGIVLYEFLSLRHPLEDKTTIQEILAELIANGIDERKMKQRFLEGGVPFEFGSVFERALERDRAKRYPTVHEMLGHIRRIQAGEVAVHCHVTAFKHVAHKAIHWVDLHPKEYTVILGFLVLVLAVGLVTSAVVVARALLG